MRFFFDLATSPVSVDAPGVVHTPVEAPESVQVVTTLHGSEIETFINAEERLRGLTLELSNEAGGTLVDDTDATSQLWRRLREAWTTHERFIIFVEDSANYGEDLAFEVRIIGPEPSGQWTGAKYLGSAPPSLTYPLRVFNTGTVEAGLYAQGTIGQPASIPIVGVDAGADSISVSGDYTDELQSGTVVRAFGSTDLNGNWTVVSTTFAAGETEIFMLEDVTGVTADGSLWVMWATNSVFDPDATFTGTAAAGRVVVNREYDDATATITDVVGDTLLTTTELSGVHAWLPGDHYMIRGGNYDWNKDGYPVDPATNSDGVIWRTRTL